MADEPQILRPVCYMVMPFRKKKVEEPLPPGAPAEIDFDALWERAYWPAIEALGYLPMRADFDPSSAIVKAMLERIAFADLVLADVTLGNGNVYYEVGIRHVAKQTRCVLIAPDWCRPLFDIGQFTSIRFRLTQGDLPQEEANAIRDLLVAKVPALKDSRTPYWELLADSHADEGRRGAFHARAAQLSEFQGKVKTARLETDSAKRKERTAALLQELPASALEIPEVSLDLVSLVRDELGWKEVEAFIGTLPDSTQKLPFVREQALLAKAELGDPVAAIAQLEQLIKEQGDTPERRGLIGGRYKRLWRAARKAREEAGEKRPTREERRHLDNAIDQYISGMELDYNQYYCSCNIPALLRSRNEEGDAERAAVIEHFVVAACERARVRGEGDEWLRPTLLGSAFRSGDVKKVTELAREVEKSDPAQWQLKSTLGDLADTIRQQDDDGKRERLQEVYEDLAALIPPQP